MGNTDCKTTDTYQKVHVLYWGSSSCVSVPVSGEEEASESSESSESTESSESSESSESRSRVE